MGHFSVYLPVAQRRARSATEFIVLASGEPLPRGLQRPTISLIQEGGSATKVSTVDGASAFARRARIPMRALLNPPSGYIGPVYRVAENLDGSVPFASVTYEALDPAGRHPASIISIVGKPRGSYIYPFPIRGHAIAIVLPWGSGYEVIGRNGVTRFWYEDDNLYLLMHINYASGGDIIPLETVDLLPLLQRI